MVGTSNAGDVKRLIKSFETEGHQIIRKYLKRTTNEILHEDQIEASIHLQEEIITRSVCKTLMSSDFNKVGL